MILVANHVNDVVVVKGQLLCSAFFYCRKPFGVLWVEEALFTKLFSPQTDGLTSEKYINHVIFFCRNSLNLWRNTNKMLLKDTQRHNSTWGYAISLDKESVSPTVRQSITSN